MTDPDEVIAFWTEEHGPQDWYAQSDALDAAIRDRFLGAWEGIASGGLTDWRGDARGTLAYLLVADQFGRNLWRGDARAFATDPAALDAAREGIESGFDLAVEGAPRQFFYLPFEHSEDEGDQDRAVTLIEQRLDSPETLLHARAHREVIRTFGRFPYRNDALGRRWREEERDWAENGGYGGVLERLRAASD
ncbi:MAG: DUF924 family protein [Paracoccaceae bacterium]